MARSACRRVASRSCVKREVQLAGLGQLGLQQGDALDRPSACFGHRVGQGLRPRILAHRAEPALQAVAAGALILRWGRGRLHFDQLVGRVGMGGGA